MVNRESLVKQKSLDSKDVLQEDLRFYVRMMMLYVASATVSLSVIKDQFTYGFHLSWVLVRLFYIPVILIAFYTAQKLNRTRRFAYEIPVWVGSFYISWYCSYIAAESGLFLKSITAMALVQLYFGISLIPIRTRTFYGCLIVSFAVSIGTVLWYGASFDLDRHLATLMLPLVIFAVCTHHVIRSNTNTRFRMMVEIERLIRSQEATIAKQAQKIVEGEVSQAIARMTQHLAHDVRKPFSLLRLGLDVLQGSVSKKEVDVQELKTNVKVLADEVNRALKTVDGMLTDVMEVGANEADFVKEDIELDALLENAIHDVCCVYPHASVNFTYALEHKHLVRCHPLKMVRVFSNILANAFQAMRFSGHIWITSREENHQMVFCIGNAHSYIPKDQCEHIFRSFVTIGKKSGTGLGLAIAQKIVTSHGGRIWCRSEKSDTFPDGKVEFFMTLPLSEESVSPRDILLPTTSRDGLGSLSMVNQRLNVNAPQMNDRDAMSGTKEDDAQTLELIRLLGRIEGKIRILFVDDERIYLEAMLSFVKHLPGVASRCVVQSTTSFEGALERLRSESWDLIVTDLDFGDQNLQGFDLIAAAKGHAKADRNEVHESLVFIHSNRIIPEDYRRASSLGADGFISKPIARSHIHKMIFQAAQKRLDFALRTKV